MDSISTASAPVSEQEVNLLNELAKIFGQFFELLFAILPVVATSTEKGKSVLMMALVAIIVLYNLTLVLGTMMQLLNENFLPILAILLLGSVVSVLALIMISSTIVWIALALWLFVFALIGYYNRQELYQMIPERIKNLIGAGMSTPQILELHETELLPV